MMNISPRRYEVHFAGRVQGVGFRATTSDVARRFAVVGFVRNLPDGRVQLVAEGDPAELQRFVAAIRDEMGRFITEHDVAEFPARGEFHAFTIEP
jgi:acylphosphatase